MSKILIIEDNESVQKMLCNTLKEEGYSPISFNNGKDSLNKIREESVDVIITDLKLPDMNGLDILKEVKNTNPLIPIIIITAYGNIDIAVEAMKNGAYDFITKPFDTEHLILLIERAMERSRLMADNLILREEFAEKFGLPKIIGKSKRMLDIIKDVKKVAASNATVLLLGESGTGKELIARAIHYLSPRNKYPFVTINCAAIPADLLENELFGHEEGAFTGASKQKLGRFELANRGTIFLDEIGDLDLSLQAKLLRVLQEREFERVGGTESIVVNLRIIAASNKDLSMAVEKRTFREDLFYRLSVFPVSLPPLRERTEDINELSNHFLNLFSHQMNKQISGISPEAMKILENYLWPGNIREMENAIERAVILCDKDVILPEHINIVNVINKKSSLSDAIEIDKIPKGTKLKDICEDITEKVEANYILNVLKQNMYNKTRAAKVLGISYKTLWNKLKKYGLELE